MKEEVDLKQIISRVLSIPQEEVGDELIMADNPQWDSLKHMNLIVDLEKHFQIRFTFEEIVKMSDVDSIKRILKEKGIKE